MFASWKWIAGLVLVAGAAIGGYWKGHHDESMVFTQFKATAAARAEKQVASNQTAVAAISASEAAALQATNQQLQESNHEATKRRDALESERSVLLGQLRQRLACPVSKGAVVPEAAGRGPGAHAASDAALPDGLADLYDFNGREFYEADQLAIKLTAAQQVITNDRLTCNGSLPGVTP